MDLFLLSRLVTALLEREQRLSLGLLRNGLDLDDQALEALLFELVEVSNVATVENGSVLVWVTHQDSASTAAAPPPASISSMQDTPAPAAVAHSEAERRQITVMFCDLVDSTRLSTQFDPEDLREIIGAYQDTVRVAIEQYAGFIARYMGDGILVYFGYPRAHEDDAERAVRASLAIVTAMADLNQDVGRRFTLALSVRIGVATGPVVIGDIVGEGAAEEAAVIGETPNLAARFQSEAEPDQVIVGSLTRQMVDKLFDFRDLGARGLKGIAEPVSLWQVLGEREADAFDGLSAGMANLPMVGRQEELGLCIRAWETAKSGQGQVILIQGEGGIGKSRLVEALREQVNPEDCTWITLRCSPFHSNSALFPVLGHLQRATSWKPEDSATDKLKKLEAALESQGIPLQEAVPLFAELMSLPLQDTDYAPLDLTPRKKREQTLDALVSWCFDEAERKPVIQVWDDIHWSDPTTLELLELYIEQSPTVPILNVLTYRPEFVLPWAMHSHMTPVTLNRLEPEEVEALVIHRAKGKAVPVEVTRHIVNKADGVPLYVEELTKTILESELLQEKKDRFELNGKLADMQIPSSLQDSLMARLDRAPTVREVAQIAAVLGREFAYEMLSALVVIDEAELNDGLTQLVGDELLYRRGRGTRARYIFKHALIQDAAYQSLLKQTRAQHHLRIAGLLEEQFKETAEAHPELVAHHYTEAAELDKAVHYWSKAGEQARRQSANLEAIAYLTRGIQVLHQMPDNEARARLELGLQVSIGHASIVAKGHGAVGAEAAYARAQQICERLGDVPELLPTLFGLWRFYVSVRPLQESRQIANQLRRLAEVHSEVEQQVISNYASGYTALCMGNLTQAKQILTAAIAGYQPVQRNVETYRAAQDPGVAGHGYLAMTLWLMGFPDQAANHAQLSIELAEELDDAFSIAYARCFTGAMVAEMRGETVESMVTPGLEVAEQGGFSLWIAFASVQQANARFNNSGSESDLANLADSLKVIDKLGVHINTPYYQTFLVRAYHRVGNIEAGLNTLKKAQASVDNRDERWWEAEIQRLRGELLLALPDADPSQASECFDRAIETSRSQSAKSLELRALLSKARSIEKSGEQEHDYRSLEECYRWFSEGFDSADLQQAGKLLQMRTKRN